MIYVYTLLLNMALHTYRFLSEHLIKSPVSMVSGFHGIWFLWTLVSSFRGILFSCITNVEVSTGLLACWCEWYECTVQLLFTIYTHCDHMPFLDLQCDVLPWKPSLLGHNQINQVSQCSNLACSSSNKWKAIWLGPSKKLCLYDVTIATVNLRLLVFL